MLFDLRQSTTNQCNVAIADEIQTAIDQECGLGWGDLTKFMIVCLNMSVLVCAACTW